MSEQDPITLIRTCGEFNDPRYDPTYGHCGHAPKCLNEGPMDDREPLGCCNCGTRFVEELPIRLAAALGLEWDKMLEAYLYAPHMVKDQGAEARRLLLLALSLRGAP